MKKISAILLASAGVVALATAASAATPNWTDGAGSWFTATNWSTATVPGAGDTVAVSNGGNAQINGAPGGSTGALTSLSINGGSTVTLGTGNNLSAAAINLGNGTSAGTLSINASPNAVTGPIVLNNGNLTTSISGSITGAVTFTGTGNTVSSTNNAGLTLSGPIGGAGAVTISAGTIQFNGTNAQTGITTIASGAQLQLGATTTNAYVDNGTLTLTFNGGTFASAVSGTGNVGASNTSGNITITGNNSYAGNTVTGLAGTFQIGNGATSGTIGAGNLVANTAVVFNRTDIVTVANSVSGGGALTFAAGTTILTGAVSNNGGITVSPGATVQFGNGGATGTTSGNITDNGAVIFNHSTQGFYTGILSGTGGVTITGAGQISFTANNTYSGVTTINSGAILSLGQGTAAGAVTGNITDNGTLSLNHSAAFTVANVISGTGGINSASTNTLTAADTYSGSTVIQLGTLALTGAGSISNSSGVAFSGAHTASLDISGVAAGTVSLKSIASCVGCTTSDVTAVAGGSIILGAKTLVLTNASGTYLGAITGTGGVTLQAGTQMLGGANTYSGATSISSGATLQIGTGGTSGTLGTGSITDSGTLVFNRSDSLTVASNIGGPGQVQVASGAIVYTGSGAWSGSTTIASGATLQFGGGTGSGSLAGAIADNGALAISKVSATLNSLISGTGTVEVMTGSALLLADNTYTGATTIDSGATLTVGNASTAGSVAGNIVDNGTINLNHTSSPTNVTVANLISGTGKVSGGGNIVFTAANTFSGGLVNTAGTQFLVGAGSVANSVVSLSGGHQAVFDISGITAAGTSIVSLESCIGCTTPDRPVAVAGASVNLGAKNLTLTNASGIFIGAINGTGALTIAGGTEILADDSTFTGGTTINAGATLQLGNATTNGGVVGNITDNGTLIVNHSNDINPTGVVSGTGAVVQAGNDTLTLTGASTYTGGTTINNGALQIGAGGTTGSIVGDVVDNAVLAFNRSDTITFAGNISGTGELVQVGPGTLILTGSNGYAGGTVISGGTLQIGNGTTVGTAGSGGITDSGTLVIAHSDDLSTATVVSGTGAVIQNGPGNLTLTGTGTFTGTTTVAGGTLTVNGSIASSSGVTVASGATLAGTGTVASTVVSSGGILAAGGAGTGSTLNVGGNLTLNSGAIFNADISATAADKVAVTGTAGIAGILNATFAATGTYAATQYTLVSSTGALSGTFANFNIANLPANFVSTLSYDAHDVFVNLSALSSSGTVTIDSGTTTISGAQTTGGLSSTGSGGTVALSSGSTLTANQTANTTFSGTVTGSGAVAKTGTGTLILDGTNTYTGGTSINGGTLEVGDISHSGASIQGPVTVGSGGTLQGHGTINGAVTIGSGGTLQPGGTIGTVTVGSASFASGSAFTVETSATQADLLQATGAVSINSGAKLTVTEDAPLSSFARTTNYTIVTAGGGVTGSFGTVSSTSATFLPMVTYGANSISLTLLRTDLVTALATNTNQSNAAAAVIAGGASALSTPLAAMNDAGVQAAYGQLAGDIHASLRSAAVEDSRIIRDAVLDHLNGRATGSGFWAVGFGGNGSIATDGNASSLHHDSAGFVAGADMDVGSGFRLGVGGAYSANDASTSGHASTASGDTGHVLAYAGWNDGKAELKLGGDMSWGNVNVARNVSAFSQSDSSRENQQLSQVFGEFGYRIGGTPIEPYIDLASISATTGAFTEAGGSAALSGGSKTDTQAYSNLGLRVSFAADWLRPRFDVAWQHGFNSFLPSQVQTLQTGSQSFTVLGAPLARDAAAVRAGVGMAISPDASLSLDYDGSVGSRVQNNAIRGGLDWRF